jgi:hypothetical protein
MDQKEAYIVQEFGTSITLNIMSIKISPTKLNINPVFVTCGSVKNVLAIGNQRGSGDIPLVRREQKDVGAGRVHFVTFPGVNCLLLNCLDLEGLQFLIEHLTQVHDNTFVN